MINEELLEEIAETWMYAHDIEELSEEDIESVRDIYYDLMAEAKSHGNMNNGSPRGEGLSPSAKKEMDRQNKMPDEVNEPAVEKQTWDAFRANNVKRAGRRRGDKKDGDSKIINAPKDVSKKASKKEDDVFKTKDIDVSVKKEETENNDPAGKKEKARKIINRLYKAK